MASAKERRRRKPNRERRGKGQGGVITELLHTALIARKFLHRREEFIVGPADFRFREACILE